MTTTTRYSVSSLAERSRRRTPPLEFSAHYIGSPDDPVTMESEEESFAEKMKARRGKR